MSILRATDSVLRKVNSILFRLIIVGYSLTLIIRFNNYFAVYWYVLIYLVYITLYLLLFRKNKFIVILRLINDYLFIVLIAWGRPINDLNVAIFLFLPLINTLNHSSNRKLTPFPVYVYILLLTSLYLLNGLIFNLKFLIPILAITLINTLFYIRLSVIDFSNSLYSTIEQFYQESFKIGKTHYLLKNILKASNQVSFIRRIGTIKHIALFKISQRGQLQILISSKFIINFSLDNEQLISKLISDGEANDYPITIDGEINGNNIFLQNTYESTQYVLFVAFDRKPFSIFFNIYLDKILKPLFSKITKVVHVEYVFQQENQKYFFELKKHLDDIESAVNAIHFLNNKLCPITSYFSLLDFYEKTDDEEIKPQLLKLIEKGKKTAITSITPITEKMNQMADKANNPNIISYTSQIKLRKLFTIIRTCFDSNNVKYTFDLQQWTEHILDLFTKSNADIFDFILQEIIINLSKHSKDECNVIFAKENNNNPTITFVNTVKNLDRNRADLVKVIADFNSEKMGEIMKRNSKGLKMIKQYLEQLDIPHKMMLNGEKLSLTLTIRTL